MSSSSTNTSIPGTTRCTYPCTIVVDRNEDPSNNVILYQSSTHCLHMLDFVDDPRNLHCTCVDKIENQLRDEKEILNACSIKADAELQAIYNKGEVKTIFKDEVPTFKFCLEPTYRRAYCTYYMKGLFEIDEDAKHEHFCREHRRECTECIVAAKKRLAELKSRYEKFNISEKQHYPNTHHIIYDRERIFDTRNKFIQERDSKVNPTTEHMLDQDTMSVSENLKLNDLSIDDDSSRPSPIKSESKSSVPPCSKSSSSVTKLCNSNHNKSKHNDPSTSKSTQSGTITKSCPAKSKDRKKSSSILQESEVSMASNHQVSVHNAPRRNAESDCSKTSASIHQVTEASMVPNDSASVSSVNKNVNDHIPSNITGVNIHGIDFSYVINGYTTPFTVEVRHRTNQPTNQTKTMRKNLAKRNRKNINELVNCGILDFGHVTVPQQCFIKCSVSQNNLAATVHIIDKDKENVRKDPIPASTSYQQLDEIFIFRLAISSRQVDIFVNSEVFFDIVRRNGSQQLPYITLLMTHNHDVSNKIHDSMKNSNKRKRGGDNSM